MFDVGFDTTHFPLNLSFILFLPSSCGPSRSRIFHVYSLLKYAHFVDFLTHHGHAHLLILIFCLTIPEHLSRASAFSAPRTWTSSLSRFHHQSLRHLSPFLSHFQLASVLVLMPRLVVHISRVSSRLWDFAFMLSFSL